MNITNNKQTVFFQENPPKQKNAVWVHHAVEKDFNSPIIAQVYSRGKWRNVEDIIEVEQLQSDWNQIDNTKADYIKNKPNISGGGVLIVSGSVENNVFTPNDGEPTLSDAIEAFFAGTTVILDTRDEDIYAETVILYNDGNLNTKNWSWLS